MKILYDENVEIMKIVYEEKFEIIKNLVWWKDLHNEKKFGNVDNSGRNGL